MSGFSGLSGAALSAAGVEEGRVHLFPMFLKLEGRACLVVGGGTVAREKIESLLRCGAAVSVISPAAVADVRELALEGRIRWTARRYEAGDAAGYQLVIAATDVREVNRHVFEEATQRGILCNTVDDPPLCDFYFGSVVERGDLQIAISTAGKSPALAQRLRREIDGQLAPDLGRWLDDVGAVRSEVLQQIAPGEERKLLLHALAQREVCSAAECPARAAALKQDELAGARR